ncbi:MAG: alpha/beta fold hydrolase [Rhodospirillaceae bacterium]|nr:alpha/beta fold hydrolase [Rhodospirillaceae bacterium]MDD9925741.1 alpha/beta fold hydrolase [Rhodospirillaceae bacterium]
MHTDYVPGPPRLAYDHMGDGEVVLFLHGIGGNRTNWRDQLPVFAAGYHAVAWDARGYGQSDDYDGPLDFGDFAHDIVRLQDHLGVATAHFVGLSMGGRIALDFVARYPGRASSLTLSGTRASFAQRTAAEREAFLRLRKKPLVEEGKEPRDIAPTVARSLMGKRSTGAHFDQLVESIAALHKESYVKTIESSTYYDRSAALEAIRVPTLLVYGGDDRLNSPKLGREIAGQIAESYFVEIPDAGHLCNIEAPEEFNDAVLTFLRKI